MVDDLLAREKDISHVSDAVAIAIDFENRTRTFYQALQERVTNKHLVDLLEFLASEELSHVDHLKSFGKTQDSSAVPDDAQAAFKRKVEEVMVKVSGEVEPTAEQIQLLLGAMRVERQAEDLYRELAHRFANDTEIAGFFALLAAFERTHYDLLDGIFAQVDDFRMQS
ncbi:MAG: ferritin family protein [Candidatus Undinarchaeales archaeon]|jgi:rubrerythrin|nr:ferritin family protein [Candidatus Undinarchaeales archaeon]